MLVMASMVASRRSADLMVAGSSPIFSASLAWMPQTCGAAIEVPEIVLMAKRDPIHVEVIDEPGA